jgi:hypothetical protein
LIICAVWPGNMAGRLGGPILGHKISRPVINLSRASVPWRTKWVHKSIYVLGRVAGNPVMIMAAIFYLMIILKNGYKSDHFVYVWQWSVQSFFHGQYKIKSTQKILLNHPIFFFSFHLNSFWNVSFCLKIYFIYFQFLNLKKKVRKLLKNNNKERKPSTNHILLVKKVNLDVKWFYSIKKIQ